MREFIGQQGFVSIVQNNADVDYLSLAYAQALSIKNTQKINQYAIIVDAATNALITDKHKRVFDKIIELPNDYAVAETWKQANEWQVFWLTPFKETIKLEVDMLFPRSVDHWWYALRLKSLCFSYDCRDYQSNIVKHTLYRRVFEENKLPNIYTGLYYLRFTAETAEFYKTVRLLYTDWDTIKKELRVCNDTAPSTDIVFALAAKILGYENYCMPSMDFINFTHMKSGVQGWSDTQPWTDYCVVEFDEGALRINNKQQLFPVHYHEKNINLDKLIKYYE